MRVRGEGHDNSNDIGCGQHQSLTFITARCQLPWPPFSIIKELGYNTFSTVVQIAVIAIIVVVIVVICCLS